MMTSLTLTKARPSIFDFVELSPFPDPDEDWELEAEDYPLFYGVENMAAKPPHQEIISDLHTTWKGLLREQGLELFMDVFMYYRDKDGILRPTAPDLWIIPLGRNKTSSYNVDKEPPPLFALEVTSKGSHKKDLEDNVDLYLRQLKMSIYLVINQVTKSGKPLKEIELRLWRRQGNRIVEKKANENDGFSIPELNTEIYPEGRHIRLVDMKTGKQLPSIDVLKILWEKETERAEQEHMRAEQERIRAEQERMRAEQERIRAEQERMRAEQAENALQETARKMLAEGFNISMITKITGFPPDEIANLT